MSVNAPKRRKNASKKSKASWRKNTDVNDIEEYLEDRRLEERLGGAFDDRPDSDLFVVDSEVPLDAKKTKKSLKCDPDLPKPKEIISTKRKAPLPRKLRSILKAKKGVESRKEPSKKSTTTPSRMRTEFDFDLWNGTPPEEVSLVNEDEWLRSETKRHTLVNNKNIPKKHPKGILDKTSKLPPVEVPHKGSSYNPSYKDHQEHLWSAAVTEIRKEKALRNIERQTTAMFPSEPMSITEKRKELYEGIPGLDEGEENPEDEKEPEEIREEEENDILKTVSFKPKTKKQRRKERTLLSAEKRRHYASLLKAKGQSVFRIKTFKRELEKRDRKIKLNMLKRKREKEIQANYLPRQLSSHKFEEVEEPIKLSGELTGNLRLLKPEGNLLEDRYKSLQKRNVIEVRKPIGRARAKVKKSEKRSYKMGWEKT